MSDRDLARIENLLDELDQIVEEVHRALRHLAIAAGVLIGAALVLLLVVIA